MPGQASDYFSIAPPHTFHSQDLAKRLSQHSFENGLIVETAGRGDTVLKLLLPLVIEDALLEQGSAVIEQALYGCLPQRNTIGRVAI
jgi:4-aminobutyrate aminotransferase-like enzyme